jgi:hypothetical protein
MPDWNTRLAVKVKVGTTTSYISPIDSFSPTFAVSAEPLHSIERTHIGVVRTQPSITFTMSVRAIGPAVAQLTQLALNGAEFDIVMQEEEGQDWSFASLVLGNCTITSATPTTATVSGAPMASFSGFSRNATTTDDANNNANMPRW